MAVACTHWDRSAAPVDAAGMCSQWLVPWSHLCRLRSELVAAGERLNADGLRVLAVAIRQLPSVHAALAVAGIGGDSSSPFAPTTPRASANGAAQADAKAASVADTSMGSGEISAATAGGGFEDAPPGRWPPGSPAGASYSSDDEADMTLIGFLAFLVSSRTLRCTALGQHIHLLCGCVLQRHGLGSCDWAAGANRLLPLALRLNVLCLSAAGPAQGLCPGGGEGAAGQRGAPQGVDWRQRGGGSQGVRPGWHPSRAHHHRSGGERRTAGLAARVWLAVACQPSCCRNVCVAASSNVQQSCSASRCYSG